MSIIGKIAFGRIGSRSRAPGERKLPDTRHSKNIGFEHTLVGRTEFSFEVKHVSNNMIIKIMFNYLKSIIKRILLKHKH
jgi:hypothetical protein